MTSDRTQLPAQTISMAEVARFWLMAGADGLLQDSPVDRMAPELGKAPYLASAVDSGAIANSLSKPSGLPVHSVTGISTMPAAEAPLAAIATAQSLDELRAVLDGWDGCGLKKTAVQTVFGDGLPGSRVMVIGETPTRDDEQALKPFSGRPGQLLERILAAIGLSRSDAYLANAIYWRPPGGRAANLDEVGQCLPFLRRQIELVSPQVLIIAGGTPVKALLATEKGVLQVRGKWVDFDATSAGHVPLMPTIHPDYLLRNPSIKRLAWNDWLEVKRKLS
jgi:uracil-DNA glycosylase